MARIVDGDDKKFLPLFPKGWAPIILAVFTLITFLAYAEPLVGTDTYTALTPYLFVVTFVYMLAFSPRDSWTNFKTAFFFDAPKTFDKLLTIGLVIAGLSSGFMTYLYLSNLGLIILSFPSGLVLASMGALFIIVTYFIVAFYEEVFSIWFTGIVANNIYPLIKKPDETWLFSLIIGTMIWSLTHIIAVGINISAFMFIFGMGFLFRMVGYGAGKLRGKLYNAYFPVAFHWMYDIGYGLSLAVVCIANVFGVTFCF